MALPAIPTTIKARKTAWYVFWNNNCPGTVMKVQPGLKYKLEPIKRGTTGLIVLGHFVTHLEGAPKIQFADVDGSLVKLLLPWQTNGEIFPPTPNSDLYQWAQPLILHPADLPLDNNGEDLTLAKTVPSTPYELPRDGEKDDMYEVEFQVYPIREKILGVPPQAIYGWVGPQPAGF
jgi:hypothetical protein